MNTNQPLSQSTLDLFGGEIYRYTRAQAIQDGVLIDITETAREVGFRWPTAITAAAWADCVAWSEEDTRRQVYQDASGRLWDVVWMALNAIRHRPLGNQLEYSLYRVPRDGHSTEAEPTRLKLVVGPGDDGEPVITILLPGED
ncbi:MAG TPA: DUF6573 family protein [Thiohalobacter sp.]|nr:DUF6573 family protein [Thiohalobacter sp.]